MHDDLIDAVEWAVRERVTTADKVAIYGGSYGGYATPVGLTFTPERFACGVDIVGPSNLATLLASIPAYWKAFFEDLARRGDAGEEHPRDLCVVPGRRPRLRATGEPHLVLRGLRGLPR